MSDPSTSISKAFQVFMTDAPQHAQAWGGMVQGLVSASALDGKTAALAYLAVLAALRLESGVPFHVQQAKQRGAARDEVISAILVGLPGRARRHASPAGRDRRLRYPVTTIARPLISELASTAARVSPGRLLQNERQVGSQPHGRAVS